MADITLAQVLAGSPPAENRLAEDRYPYGKPRFPNLDPRAYFDDQTRKDYAQEPFLNKLGEIAPWALMGLARAPVARPQPMTPQLVRREVKEAGDDSFGQHVYETLLGRVRRGGDAVGKPYPFLTNPGAWPPAAAAGGLGGYLGYKAFDNLVGAPSVDEMRDLATGPKWGELFKDIVTGRIAQKKRDFDAAQRDERLNWLEASHAGVPYPPDPNRP